MGASQVRVRPPHSHVGLLALSALFGALMAVPIAAHTWFWRYLPDYLFFGRHSFWIINSTQVVIAFIPFLIFLIWLPRQCQHVRWIAAAGALYALSLAVFSMLGTDAYMPQLAWVALAEHLALLLMAPVIGAGLAVLAAVIYRKFVSRLIEQDGSLCNHCGYPVQPSQSSTCPECGREIGTIRPSHSERLCALAARWKGTISIVLLAVLGVGYALIARAEYNHRTLGHSYGKAWSQSKRPGFYSGGLQTTAYQEVSLNGKDAVIVVGLARRPVWKPRHMQIRIGYAYTLPSGARSVMPGEPEVAVNVPRESISDVLRDGPPDDLVERLLDEANRVQWEPSLDMPSRVVEVPWEEHWSHAD